VGPVCLRGRTAFAAAGPEEIGERNSIAASVPEAAAPVKRDFDSSVSDFHYLELRGIIIVKQVGLQGRRLIMLRSLACGLVCSMGVSAFAQFRNEVAIDELAQTIVRQVGDEYSCELQVLWVFSEAPQQGHVVRVHPDGEDCEGALARATELGRNFAIRFATLKEIVDDSRSATARAKISLKPRRNPDQTPAPPLSFDLIDDRIEP